MKTVFMLGVVIFLAACSTTPHYVSEGGLDRRQPAGENCYKVFGDRAIEYTFVCQN